ncbi:MAG: D-amino acid dehydrogenase [Marinobacter sp.]|uniref:D-amino acid dehydrogenase n=1 Tax=Marinobacter sp. TaxID=50741 RepID=UPI00299DA375|nr:D-amino acid dehydrogenase [Marinobacter sp.]MDX1634875.1 D-amino acid dehydrogenase [Marinobacter sp.]
MHVVVVGAGVVGVTTAWALRQRGHRVTVVERLAEAGLETSRANAAQRSYGVVYPWASAAMVRKALPMLVRQDGALKMALPPSMATLRFLLDTLRFAYAPGLYGLNRRAMVRLAMHSRECFGQLEDLLDLAFDGDHAGLLHLASSPEALAEYRATAALLDELGVANRLLTPAQVREVEPGMTGHGPLHGALSYDTDGTGDCHLFTQALARATRADDVSFRYRTGVRSLVTDARRVSALALETEAGERETLDADAVVICAGCTSPHLLQGLGLRVPIYPVKGYSLTTEMTDASRGPRSTVHDDHFKVVSTRLGNRLRVSGFVELADFDRAIPERRLQTLRKSVAARFPGAADLSQARPWTGFRPMTPDGPPMLGRGPRDNLFLNTGHGTFGWTLSAGSADLIARLIDGEALPLNLDPFRPGRFSE